MKTQKWIAAQAALFVMTAASLTAADMTRFDARPGSKVRLEGTSSVHDWQLESKIIGGFIEAGPNFPTEPGQTVQPGKVDAKVEAFITTRSLQSLNKDGTPYSKNMDDVVYENMKESTHKRILYFCKELVLKEPAKSKDAPYVFESKGDLVVGGVTNQIAMPLNVTPLGDKKIKVTGNTTVKMTDFQIKPPAPKLALGFIKTGDEVKLAITWMLAQRSTPAAAASK